MRVFITGATGWIGSAVTDELLAEGHRVLGLSRSATATAALQAKGATPHPGALDDLDSLATGAEAADAVIHLAFNHDFSDYSGAGHTERAAVERMLSVLKGTDRPFLFASGLGGAEGRRFTEDDPSPFHGADSMRGGSENLALSFVDKGVRAVALRFSRSVHGAGDPGLVAALTEIAARTGTAAYIGDGANRWPAVHRHDAARLVRLALAKAPAGSRVHAVAEPGIATRDIATAISEYLGLPVSAIDPADAKGHFGWLGGFFGGDVAASSDRTRELLGWTPTGPTLLEDIAAGAYPAPVSD